MNTSVIIIKTFFFANKIVRLCSGTRKNQICSQTGFRFKDNSFFSYQVQKYKRVVYDMFLGLQTTYNHKCDVCKFSGH